MRDVIRFYLNGQRIEAGGDDVFLTLSEFLRKSRGLTGTKVVCAEGDCGSCTVLLGRPESGELGYSAVTSCIQFLFQLDAAHVVTVEGLRDGDALNPIQQSMVSCHGAQCGFCTPGFVVALHGLMADGAPVDRERIRRGLTGNLCRCTGYDSILRAALLTDQSRVKLMYMLDPALEIYRELVAAEKEEVRIETPQRRFFKPVTVADAARYRLENPGCAVVAGGTDLGVVHNKRIRPITIAMGLGGIASLQGVRVEPGMMHVGAGATLAILQWIAQEHLPELGRFMEWFGSPLIRNAGTIGGNLVTGSPIGDTIPALLVLGAEIELTGINGTRVVPIDKFYTGYRQTVLASDELLTTVRIPLLGPGQILKLYKISRRKDLDITSFGAAIWLKLFNGVIEDVRLAFGGVGPMVMRMPATEAILRGNEPTLNLFEKAGEVARHEVKPISDVRGSAEYRRLLAANILVKFWHETFSNEAPDVRPWLRAGD